MARVGGVRVIVNKELKFLRNFFFLGGVGGVWVGWGGVGLVGSGWM